MRSSGDSSTFIYSPNSILNLFILLSANKLIKLLLHQNNSLRMLYAHVSHSTTHSITHYYTRRPTVNNRTPARKVRSDKGISRSRSSISLLDAQFTYPGIPCNVCIRTAESKQEDLVKCTVCERLGLSTYLPPPLSRPELVVLRE